jgi:thioredoxin 1
MSATNIDDSEFDSSVVKQKQTAAILFWASWDGGSRSFMPTYEQVADENRYKLGFYKMDVDSTQVTMTKIGVRSVPTVTIFKDGQLTGQIVGAVTKAKLSTLIDSI